MTDLSNPLFRPPGARAKAAPANALDPGIEGLWQIASFQYRVTADGTYSLIGPPSAYAISAGGRTLTLGSTDYTRVLGGGASLVGVWQGTFPDGNDIWLEDMYLRADGTYTIQWTVNGVFDSLYYGTYGDMGSQMQFEERRAVVTTFGADQIRFDPPYSPIQEGTYTLDAGIGTWSVTLDGQTIVYTRVV